MHARAIVMIGPLPKAHAILLAALLGVVLLTMAVARIFTSDVEHIVATEVPAASATFVEPLRGTNVEVATTTPPHAEIQSGNHEASGSTERVILSDAPMDARASEDAAVDTFYDVIEPTIASMLPTPFAALRATSAVRTDEIDIARETVRRGDTLEAIFSRLEISRRELHNMLAANAETRNRLQDLQPGQDLEVRRIDGAFVSLDIDWGPLESLSVMRNDDGSYRSKLVKRQPERVTAYRHGQIEHSLFLTGQGVGLTDDITLRLAQIFQWDIDFVLDIRKGDEFHLLFNELFVDNEFIGFGEILAAEFVNRGRTYRAVRYDDDSYAGFFTPDGDSMRKAFLRAPLDFTRVSSSFNPNRVHPLWKHSMPHRGVDYAARRGTPVYAAGDGKVTIAGRTKPNGNYVVIQHGEKFETKYLHLSKFGPNIRRGRRVTQGDVIGYVGSTGWATGPHLHYEFLVNGVHQNPATVKLPEAMPVPPTDRERFDTTTSPLLLALEREKHRYTVVEPTSTAGD